MQSFRALGCCILLLAPCVVGVGVSAKVATAAERTAAERTAASLERQGEAAFQKADFVRAVEYLTRAAQLAPAQVSYQTKLSNAHFWWARHLQAHFHYNDALRHSKEALRYYQQALTINREVKNRRSEARVLNNIGETYEKLGRSKEALRYYQQALTIERAIKDRKDEVTTLSNIARLHRYHDKGH